MSVILFILVILMCLCTAGVTSMAIVMPALSTGYSPTSITTSLTLDNPHMPFFGP